jgi:hypothetical protein
LEVWACLYIVGKVSAIEDSLVTQFFFWQIKVVGTKDRKITAGGWYQIE